jgi:hypothetical protein
VGIGAIGTWLRGFEFKPSTVGYQVIVFSITFLGKKVSAGRKKSTNSGQKTQTRKSN